MSVSSTEHRVLDQRLRRDSALRMTEREFEEWCDSETWAEWVRGEVIVMSPVNYPHGRLHMFLAALMRGFVEERNLGELLSEPFQTRFVQLRQRRSPDLMFIRSERLGIITNTYVDGAPDLILEVVSPESQNRDRRDKYFDYQTVGVAEYWLVDPLSKTLDAHVLGKNKRYQPIEMKGGRLGSSVLSGFYLQPTWLWGEKFPRVSTLLRQMRARKS